MHPTRAAIAMLLLSAGVSAAPLNPDDKPSAETLSKASSWLGANVEDRAGNNVGEVKDLAIDWRAGTVAYAVVAIEHWLHIDSKLVAIPVDRITVDDAGKHVVVRMTEEEVSALPAIDAHNLPLTEHRTGATQPKLADNRADDRGGMSDRRVDDPGTGDATRASRGESEAADRSATTTAPMGPSSEREESSSSNDRLDSATE